MVELLRPRWKFAFFTPQLKFVDLGGHLLSSKSGRVFDPSLAVTLGRSGF